MGKNYWGGLEPALHAIGLATGHELSQAQRDAKNLEEMVTTRDIELVDFRKTGTHLVEYNRELVSRNIELTAQVPAAPPFVATVRSIPNVDLASFLRFALGPTTKFWLGDSLYPISLFEDIQPVVDWWRGLPSVQQMLYILDEQDCDDFSLAFAGDMSKFKPICGFPYFLCWGDYPLGPHAANLVVFDDPSEDSMWTDSTGGGLSLAFIEPQNGVVEKLAIDIFDELKLWVALTS